MLTYYLILIFAIFTFILIKKSITNKRERKIREKKLAEREKKLAEEIKSLRNEKKKEDEILDKKTSVLCDDGIERTYCGFMYGIIKDKKSVNNDGPEKTKIYSEYIDINIENYRIPTRGNKGNAYLYNFDEKWFSSEGEMLKKNDIIRYRLNEIEKQIQYKIKYNKLNNSRIHYNWSILEHYNIHFINGIYFVETSYFGEVISFDILNGVLNDVLFIDGFISNQT